MLDLNEVRMFVQVVVLEVSSRPGGGSEYLPIP